MRIMKWLLLAAILVAAAASGWWLMRPSPADAAPTHPQWVRDLDGARVDTPGGGLPFTLQSGGSYARLRDAVRKAQAVDTITIMPGVYEDCAVISKGRLTIRAMIPGSVTFKKKLCEGKGGIVVAAEEVTIEGLHFTGYTMRDGNGAGIRFEKGDLYVDESIFEDSDTGLLSGNALEGQATVRRSIFRRLGRCRPDNCSHSLYMGRVAALTVKESLFEEGHGGHYIKARVKQVDISDNLIDDSKGTRTNYLIDLPEGAVGEIRGNALIKGTNAENKCCAIVVSAEFRDNDASVLIDGNQFANLADRPVLLLGDYKGQARLGSNQTLGWFIERGSFTVADKCVACKLLSGRIL